jgi:hypothetical protein
MRPEYVDPDVPDHSVAADVLVRKEPDEDDDEDDEEEDEEEEDADDREDYDEGYSE